MAVSDSNMDLRQRLVDTIDRSGVSARRLSQLATCSPDTVRNMRRGNLEEQGSQRVLRFREKAGKQREIPVCHDLDCWLGVYLEVEVYFGRGLVK